MKLLMAGAGLVAALAGVVDPLAVMAPCVALTTAERRALDRGAMVSRALPGADGQVALFASARVEAPPDALVAAAREIADLKKSTFVLAIRRFSDPPQLSDLDDLVLNPRDVRALAECEPGRCSFKLTAAEITSLMAARHRDGTTPAAVTAALRRVILERVNTYRSGGLAAVAPIANRGATHRLDETLAALQQASPCLLQAAPLAGWVRHHDAPGVESFLYWSQEVYGPGKPVVLVTHVGIARPEPGQAIVIGKQIFASRYLDGALAMTAISTDADGRHYLAYLNRSRVDLLGGFFGGLKRAMLESRLSDELPAMIAKLKDRLERRQASQLHGPIARSAGESLAAAENLQVPSAGPRPEFGGWLSVRNLRLSLVAACGHMTGPP